MDTQSQKLSQFFTSHITLLEPRPTNQVTKTAVEHGIPNLTRNLSEAKGVSAPLEFQVWSVTPVR